VFVVTLFLGTLQLRIGELMPKKKASRPVQQTPYFDLLDFEIGRRIEKPVAETVEKAGRGRRPSPFSKSRTYAYLTDDQKKMLDEVVAKLGEKWETEISRGDVIAFLTYQLVINLRDEDGSLTIPDEVKNFSTLSNYLSQLDK
jgi:hypothetical protein